MRGVQKERHLGAGVRRQFDGEALAVGSDERGVDDAAFEDCWHVIADAERGRWSGWAGSGEGDRAEDQRNQAGGEGEALRVPKPGDDGSGGDGGCGEGYVAFGKFLVARDRESGRNSSERRQQRLVEAHMTLWPYAP